MEQLNRKQKNDAMQALFAREYLIDFNGKQAAIRAGYSAHTAAAQASRLLSRDNVQKILQEGIKRRNENADLTADHAVGMVRAVAEADPNALVEMRRGCCRYCHGQGGQYQYTAQEWRRTQEEYQAARDAYDKRATDKAPPFPPLDVKGGIGFNPNTAPAENCTECFGEGEVRTFINDTRNLTPEQRRLFGGVKETANGIQLIVNSQDKARELLMRHTGALIDRIGNPDGTPFANPNPAPMIVRFVSPGKKDAA